MSASAPNLPFDDYFGQPGKCEQALEGIKDELNRKGEKLLREPWSLTG